MTQQKKPELLCPAGDLTRLYAAVDFGADAVYLAGEEFGMRTAAKNFSINLFISVTFFCDYSQSMPNTFIFSIIYLLIYRLITKFVKC